MIKNIYFKWVNAYVLFTISSFWRKLQSMGLVMTWLLLKIGFNIKMYYQNRNPIVKLRLPYTISTVKIPKYQDNIILLNQEPDCYANINEKWNLHFAILRIYRLHEYIWWGSFVDPSSNIAITLHCHNCTLPFLYIAINVHCHKCTLPLRSWRCFC